MNTISRNGRLRQHVVLLTVMEHAEDLIKKKEIGNVNLSYEMITRNVKNKTLVNTETSKEFKFEYDKRMIMPEKDCTIDILPWSTKSRNFL